MAARLLRSYEPVTRDEQLSYCACLMTYCRPYDNSYNCITGIAPEQGTITQRVSSMRRRHSRKCLTKRKNFRDFILIFLGDRTKFELLPVHTYVIPTGYFEREKKKKNVRLASFRCEWTRAHRVNGAVSRENYTTLLCVI